MSPSPPPMELAPLSELQSAQRRASVADPARRPASPPARPPHHPLHRQPHPHIPASTRSTSPRPASPHVFGDAPRDAAARASASGSRGNGAGASGDTASASSSAKVDHQRPSKNMAVDAPEQTSPPPPKPPPAKGAHGGRKRKAATAQDIDPQLVGPGVHSAAADVEMEQPSPKRRGSVVEAQQIAGLSLYERRNSVDSRGVGAAPPPAAAAAAAWPWTGDGRLDGGPAMFAPGVTAYQSAFSGGEPSHARPHPPGIATFAWPANTPLQSTSSSNPDPAMPGAQRPPFDHPNGPPAMPMIPSMHFPPHDHRRMSVPDMVSSSSAGGGGPTRVLRSRSRTQSRPAGGELASPAPASPGTQSDAGPSSAMAKKEPGVSPYSRSPELRVSHKLAERKRRKEMKDLFDELRDQLPADRGMKASKWEILSKAIDFVSHLKQNHQDMAREIEMLRHELDAMRQASGLPPLPPGVSIMYGQGPPIPGQYPGPLPPISHHGPQQQQQPHAATPNISRPGSSQNAISPTAADTTTPAARQNGNSTTSAPSNTPAI